MAKDRPLDGIPKGTVLGTAPCDNCGFETLVKVDSAAHAYAYCIAPDGGCGNARQSKARGATMGNLRRITSWKDGNKAKVEAVLGEPIKGADPKPAADPAPAVDPAPAPAPKPAVQKTPAADPAPAAAADDDDWWD
jgi:hypothetical protein